MENENDKIVEKDGAVVTVAIIFGIWALLGFIAFIMSLVCFGKNGTIAEKILGLILAILFGPFYFIYYFAAKDYCKNPLITSITSKRK